MSTLNPMTRTAAGWRCERCGSTMEDTLLPVRSAECNCEGLGLVPAALVADVGVPLKAALDAVDEVRRTLDATTGLPDTFRYGLARYATPEELQEAFPKKKP